MTHAVVWIDHKEARIFHVHPEAAEHLVRVLAREAARELFEKSFLTVESDDAPKGNQ
jgi:hypothetical protein